MLHLPTLIESKRDGAELTPDDIRALIAAFTRGEVPDYQMSALAMAVYFRGMTAAETTALTGAMLDSGDRLEWPADSPVKVDKHSTGGIGDKVSLVLAPLLACTGHWVPMISGRGLGITGGTLDKLESIPGYRTDLSADEILATLRQAGAVITGQTGQLCPADKRLYALRDVTGTVPSRPLIVASIMSKKLAESLDRLVLDVKFGSGAFMRDEAEARLLADAMVQVGRQLGVRTDAVLTPMDQPLGHAVGNALEVVECIDTLRGRGPADLVELTLDLAAAVADCPRETLADSLRDGRAWTAFCTMVEAQGGEVAALETLSERHRAPFVADLKADRSGRLSRLDAGVIGRTCVRLGGGRQRAGDAIDFRVGMDRIVKTGAEVRAGDTLMRVHATTPGQLAEAVQALGPAVGIE